MSLKTIFQEGMKERRRRRSLGRMGSELREKEKTHAGLLTALGRKAWENQADISAFAGLRTSLDATQKELDGLRADAGRLQTQRQEIEERKKQENDRLGAALKDAEEKKGKLDRRLEEQKGAMQAGQKEAQHSRDRLAAIARERNQLQEREAAPATAEAEKGEITRALDLLAQEESALKTAIDARTEAGKPIATLMTSLQEESNQWKKRVDDLRQEQRQVTAELDKKISALKSELARNSEKTRETEARQQGDFGLLGDKLASAQNPDPALAAEIAAAAAARSVTEGVQALIGGLERQRDDAQVSAYKKMTAIVIGAIALLAAVIAALVLLLAPKGEGSPIAGKGTPAAEGMRRMEQLAQTVQEGLGGIKAESERIQGGKITIAGADVLKSALPFLNGWQMQEPRYSRGAYAEMETASLEAGYAGPGGRAVRVQITDAGTASALLAGLKIILSMNVSIDDADTFQRVAAVNGTPVVERLDKQGGEATIGIVYRDRYLIELRTRAASGLEILRKFAARLELSKLRP